MDYQGPDLCIVSAEQVSPGRYALEMPSVYDPTPQPPYEVSQRVLDSIIEDRGVVMCPPGWPEGHPHAPEVDVP